MDNKCDKLLKKMEKRRERSTGRKQERQKEHKQIGAISFNLHFSASIKHAFSSEQFNTEYINVLFMPI
jgi:hypothetical protein